MKRNVLVIMSTYNGEAYLRQQLGSIINQKNIKPFILVRDDGSIDETQNILNEYSAKGLLEWYTGENIGACKSFFDLIKKAPSNFEYIAFADQDDFWYENKLYFAIQELEKYRDIETLYFCNTKVTDEQLNPINNSFGKHNMYSFGSSLLGVSPPGCTMVFNKTLMNRAKSYIPQNARMHDHWLLIICFAFNGKVIEDKKELIMYRQHKNNVVGGNAAFTKILQRYTKSFFENRNERLKQAEELFQSFNNALPSNRRDELLSLINYRKNLRNKMKLINNTSFRTKTKKDILFFISIILNRF